MAVNSKAKGARFERTLASRLREYGYDCRRGQQYCGANGDADVVGLPGVHIEVKRRERLDIYEAVEQAKREAKPGELPVVFFRKNNSEWLSIMPIDACMTMYREFEAGECIGTYKT